jgi:rRNA pseudouridine-1189 N-methylase Emg1 (Nep1/Mra1 family)
MSVLGDKMSCSIYFAQSAKKKKHIANNYELRLPKNYARLRQVCHDANKSSTINSISPELDELVLDCSMK